ncbi:MAG: YdcF family protein [Terracidiphilus sp.]
MVVGLVAWAAIARALAPTANTAQDHFDVLMVLGGPADGDGNPTPTELARVTEAVNEYERGVAPRMIMTGGPAHNRFVEADVMARVAEAQGIPADAIAEERTARNTMENACDSLRIMRNHGWESAEVISSPSHLPRAALILSQLPLKWRTHAAPALEPEGPWTQGAMTSLEILKTVRYLVWARQIDGCSL